jgi:hypothetical protein
VTKNSILLVDFANQQVERGATSRQAMEESGRVRLRPILMTAFATIAGILPIAIGFGAGAESRRPMGYRRGRRHADLAPSSPSSIIPVVYTLLSDLAAKLKPKAAVEGLKS